MCCIPLPPFERQWQAIYHGGGNLGGMVVVPSCPQSRLVFKQVESFQREDIPQFHHRNNHRFHHQTRLDRQQWILVLSIFSFCNPMFGSQSHTLFYWFWSWCYSILVFKRRDHPHGERSKADSCPFPERQRFPCLWCMPERFRLANPFPEAVLHFPVLGPLL